MKEDIFKSELDWVSGRVFEIGIKDAMELIDTYFINKNNEVLSEFDKKLKELYDSFPLIKHTGSACKHASVPFVKSHYSEEMVQRGKCEECDSILLELD